MPSACDPISNTRLWVLALKPRPKNWSGFCWASIRCDIVILSSSTWPWTSISKELGSRCNALWPWMKSRGQLSSNPVIPGANANLPFKCGKGAWYESMIVCWWLSPNTSVYSSPKPPRFERLSRSSFIVTVWTLTGIRNVQVIAIVFSNKTPPDLLSAVWVRMRGPS